MYIYVYMYVMYICNPVSALFKLDIFQICISFSYYNIAFILYFIFKNIIGNVNRCGPAKRARKQTLNHGLQKLFKYGVHTDIEKANTRNNVQYVQIQQRRHWQVRYFCWCSWEQYLHKKYIFKVEVRFTNLRTSSLSQDV